MPHINDFPPEILGEIFVQVTIPESQDISFPSKINFASPAPYSPNYRSVASPYSISHVSRRWRDIALTTASLWSRLCVVQPQSELIVRLLEEWMTRAGCVPMRLSLFEHSYKPSSSVTVAVLVLFLNSIHRCREFEMEVKTLAGRQPDYSRIDIRECTDLLQSVSVRDETPDSTATYRPFIMTRLLSSPNLRFVQWHHHQLLPLSVAAHFWSELRELRFETTEVDLVDLGYALSYCQGLERLAVFSIHILHSRLAPVSLPRLTHLSASSEVMAFFDYLTVPSLTDLEILGGELEGAWSFVLRMLWKSKAVPRVLKLHCVSTHWPVKEEELLRALAMPCFAALQVLEVEHLVGPRTIEFLLSSLNLPHLGRLVLIIDPYMPSLSTLLSALVYSRVYSRLGSPNWPDINMNRYVEYTSDGFRLSLDILSK